MRKEKKVSHAVAATREEKCSMFGRRAVRGPRVGRDGAHGSRFEETADKPKGKNCVKGVGEMFIW